MRPKRLHDAVFWRKGPTVHRQRVRRSKTRAGAVTPNAQRGARRFAPSSARGHCVKGDAPHRGPGTTGPKRCAAGFSSGCGASACPLLPFCGRTVAKSLEHIPRICTNSIPPPRGRFLTRLAAGCARSRLPPRCFAGRSSPECRSSDPPTRAPAALRAVVS